MRRTPLQRRRPLLLARTELKRTELARGKPLQRQGRLNPVSPKRRSDNRVRAVVVSAMREAAAGRCARCGRRDLPVHGHERRGRAQGGDILAPECVLCPPCNSAIEDTPQVSCWNGWKTSPKWPHDPALTSTQARDLFGNVVEFEVAHVA